MPLMNSSTLQNSESKMNKTLIHAFVILHTNIRYMHWKRREISEFSNIGQQLNRVAQLIWLVINIQSETR